MTKIKTAALPELPTNLIAPGQLGSPIGRYRSLRGHLDALGVELPVDCIAPILDAVEVGQRMIAPLANVVDEIEAAAHAGRDWTTDARVIGAAIASSYSEGLRQRATANLDAAVAQMLSAHGEDLVRQASAAADCTAIVRAAELLPEQVTSFNTRARATVPNDLDALAAFVGAAEAERHLTHAIGVFAAVNGGHGPGRGRLGALALADIDPAELIDFTPPGSGASLPLAVARLGYQIELTTPTEFNRRINAFRRYEELDRDAEREARGKGPGTRERVLAELLKTRF